MQRKKETGFLNEVSMTYRAIAQTRYAWICWLLFLLPPAILIIADLLKINLGFLQVNQARTLGYEFSFVTGILAAHLSALTGAIAARMRVEKRPATGPYSKKEDPRRYMLGSFWGALLFNWVALLIPLTVICFYDAIRPDVVNCDYANGFAHYLLIGYITAWLSTSIGFFGGVIFNRAYKGYLLFLLLFVLSLFGAFLKAYFGPRVVLFEMFSGVILLPNYAYQTSITTGFILYRMMAIFWAAVFVNLAILSCSLDAKKFGLAQLRRSFSEMSVRLPEWQMIWLAVVVLILGAVFQGPLGMGVTRPYLNSVLDTVISTEHFDIRYPSASPVGKDIEAIAESHEFYYYQITSFLQIEAGPRITSYIYPNDVDKVRMTGSDASVFAKPWNNEIHIVYSPGGNIRALKHELTHVIARVYGSGLFKVPLNYGLAEGLAEAVYWMPDYDLTSDQISAAFRRKHSDGTESSINKYAISPARLFLSNGAFSAGINQANYYAVASFVKFLMRTYPADQFLEVYRRGTPTAFRPVYGKPLSELNAEWEKYIDSIQIDDAALDYTEYMFRSGPFSKLKCAHTVAEHALAARQYSMLQQYGKVIEEYEALIATAPDNIQWAYGVLNALYLDGRYDEVLKYAPRVVAYPDLIPSWEHRINLRVGDTYARLGDISSAISYYEMAQRNAVAESQREAASNRLHAAAIPEELLYILEGADQQGDASTWFFEKAAETAPEDYLPLYYITTDLVGAHEYAEALKYIDRALALEVSMLPHLRDLYLYRGVCMYHLGSYDDAKFDLEQGERIEAQYFKSLGRDDSIEMEVFRNWLDRCEWRKTWRPPEINKDKGV